MSLSDLIGGISDFHDWNHVEKIILFAWFQHTHGKERFNSTEIRLAYEELHLDKPANIANQLEALATKNPKQLLKDVKGYSLVGGLRTELQRKHGSRPTALYVSKLILRSGPS